MCDDRTERDLERYRRRRGMTRRDFGATLSAAALAALLPPVANAREVQASDVLVPTPDGDADCSGVVDFADILVVLSEWGNGCE